MSIIRIIHFKELVEMMHSMFKGLSSLLLLPFVMSSVYAAPEGGVITSGSGNIQSIDAQTTIVDQQLSSEHQ